MRFPLRLSIFTSTAVTTAKVAGTTARWTASRLDPKVDREIMTEIGERKVLEIRKHWFASSWAIGRLLLAALLLLWMVALNPSVWYEFIGWFFGVWWVIFIGSRAVWRILEHYRDRFVITNQRILRVDGVVGSSAAMIPLRRITDVTVQQSWLGKLMDFGHMIFESAGLVQGLNEIRYVANPKKRKRILLIAMNGDNPDSLVLDPAEGNPQDDGT